MGRNGSQRLDVLLALCAAAAMSVNGLLSSSFDGSPVVVIALSAATCAPLVWRRRYPVAVLLAVGAGLIVCLAVFEAYYAVIAVAMVALYTVAVLGDRRRSLVVGVVSALVLAGAIALLEATGNVAEGTMRLLLVLGALVVGDAVRTRRALREAAVERIAREQRERDAESRLRMDEERLQIARELHDTIAHALVAINVRAGVAEHLARPDPTALPEIKQVSADALRDLRATLDVLRERSRAAPTTPTQDLSSVDELLESARAGGLQTHADVSVEGATIAAPIGQAAFRIIQESLTNVLRHAHATHAHVVVSATAQRLEIDVLDDGRGGTPAGQGHGLRGMTERAAALGGTVAAGPGREGGWHVHADLPLRSAAQA